MTNYKTYYVYGERPKVVHLDAVQRAVEIPKGWLIFNAPRPLLATEHMIEFREGVDYPVYLSWQDWTDDGFIHGRFYVAVDPNDGYAIKENVGLDGWVLQYVNDNEIEAWVRARIAELNLKEYDQYDLEQLKQSFFFHHNKE
jgi:hypothetical protein